MEGPDHILSSDKKEMLELIKQKKFLINGNLGKKITLKNLIFKKVQNYYLAMD
jgi:hypothetical protein